MENSIVILDNLTMALQLQPILNDDEKQDCWFKIIHTMQEKILFNPQTYAYGGLTL